MMIFDGLPTVISLTIHIPPVYISVYMLYRR